MPATTGRDKNPRPRGFVTPVLWKDNGHADNDGNTSRDGCRCSDRRPKFRASVLGSPERGPGSTNFARLVTAPAVRPSRIVPVGELQVGAGPVIAPDGTVFIGNLYGQLLPSMPTARRHGASNCRRASG